MIIRLLHLSIGIALGVAAAILLPTVSQSVRGLFSSETAPAAVRGDAGPAAQVAEKADETRAVKLSDAQIAETEIALVVAGGATLARRLTVPGTILASADRIARVAVRLSGTVAEMRKKLGDPVREGEVLAVLESREVADAKSEYLAARLGSELQQELATRDKDLWERRVVSEQQYLRSRNLAEQARIRVDIARQKLLALGLPQSEITALPSQPEASLRRYEVRSPKSGRVVERKVDLGTAVGRDNLETELFVIVDLDRVWVDLAVSPADLLLVKEGEVVTVTSRAIREKVDGQIIFISPLLDRDTRTVRVVAEIVNSSGAWRPGSFVSAEVAVEQQSVTLAVPTSAIQTLGGDKVVFVRTADGFEKRPVVLGRGDARFTEITAGLRPGEIVASANTFLLKAEFLKGQAED